MLTIILLFFFFVYRLINKIGKSFPLFELVAVLYLLQYGIAPLLEYNINPEQTMSIPKDEYIGFATFSCLAFIVGLFSVKNKFKWINISISSELASIMGRAFLLISFLAYGAFFILPNSLVSILTFFLILKSQGVFCLIYSDKKIDKVIIAVIFLETAISAILDSALVAFVVFAIFFSMFYSLRYTISNKLKLVVVLSGLLFLSVYQSVKLEYRSLIWEEGSSWQSNLGWAGKFAVLSELITIDSFFLSKIINRDSSLCSEGYSAILSFGSSKLNCDSFI